MADDIQALFEQGKKLLDDEKTEDAANIFARLVAITPNNAEFHAWYAQALNRLTKTEDAMREANIAIRLNPNAAKGYRQRGNAERSLGRYIEAIESFSKAAQIDPIEANPYETIGDIYKDQLEKYDLAIASYNKSIETNSTTARNYAERGHAYWYLENHDQAIESYEKAIEIDPNYAWAYSCLGWLYTKKKQYQASIRAFSRAIEIEPKNQKHYADRATSYFDIQNYEDYFLDLARAGDLGRDLKIYSSSDTSKEMAACIEGCNEDFVKVLIPQTKAKGETPVIWYPTLLLMWDRQRRQIMVNGASFDQDRGYIGQGYIYVTRQSVHIVSKGSLARIVEKSSKSRLSFLRHFIPGGDKTEYVLTDQYWTIPHNAIQSAQIIHDKDINQNAVRMVSGDTPWDIYGYYNNQNDILLTCLNLAKAGKFANIWNASSEQQQKAEQNPIELLKELAKLMDAGILTDEEFATKKAEILARM